MVLNERIKPTTYIVVVDNPKALEVIEYYYPILAICIKHRGDMFLGDALFCRDTLYREGFHWGSDFHLKKLRG